MCSALRLAVGLPRPAQSRPYSEPYVPDRRRLGCMLRAPAARGGRRFGLLGALDVRLLACAVRNVGILRSLIYAVCGLHY